MAKIPKIPKSIPKKLPTKPQTFRPQAPRPPPSTIPKTTQNTPVKPLPYKPEAGPKHKTQWQLEDEAAHRAKVGRWRQFPIVACGIIVFGAGLYGAQLWISLSRAPQLEDVPEDVSDRFDKEAEGYDEKVGTAEWMLRLTSRRNALTKMAKGHVLEVAVGTGRNTPFYPTKQCHTVTLLDQSKPMLDIAKRKWKDQHPEYFSRVFFKQQSALDPITPPYGAQDGYDTVIQTMGLCSTPEPERLLCNLEAVTKEDGGQILLLEHGKSYFQWLNNLLDKTAPAHANEHGCWWNKDIGKIVDDSGLEVVQIKRYNFGTTWWVELRPRKGSRKNQGEGKGIMEEQARVPPDSQVAQKTWWNFWK